ncbi:MAG: ABC transporter ATP-binding protein [Clostridia bacterium]|nr:ABC transporter ATP-binding protein [Clostridia bacterium]
MTKKEIMRRIFRYIAGEKGLTFCSFAASAVYVALTLAVPILVGRAVGTLETGKIGGIFPYLAVILACAGAGALCQWIMGEINNRISVRILRDLRADAYRKLSKLPFSYLDRVPSGDTVSRIMTDAEALVDGILMGFTQLFTGVLTVVGTVVFMLTMNVTVTLVVAVLTPLSVFFARFIARGTFRHFKKRSELQADLTAYTEETVTGRKVVRAFGREEETYAAFAEKDEKLRRISGKAIFLSSLTNPVTRFLNALVYAAVTLVGAFLCVRGGNMTVGMLTSFLAYANQYTKPFNEISGVLAELQNAFACAARVFEFLDEEEETPDPADPAEVRVTGRVGAEDVSFSYTKEQKLIEHFSLDVRPGEHIAIVGPTGCGKTTLINLLMRFYDVNAGRMTVEGVDVRALRRRDLRASYGMVLQENWIGKMSVTDNIRRGKPDATAKEVEAAARAAHAHGFISRLPQGYDTVLEENGEGLSAGQRQLICIAAVMLVDPPMLILDEATASIDTRTEKKIQDAFEKLMRGRTTFIVAHRLSTIRNADKILVMNNGSIVESGTHEELLKKGGFYARLYNAQYA